MHTIIVPNDSTLVCITQCKINVFLSCVKIVNVGTFLLKKPFKFIVIKNHKNSISPFDFKKALISHLIGLILVGDWELPISNLKFFE